MLRTATKRCVPNLPMLARSAAFGPNPVGSYESQIVEKELEFNQRRRVRALIQKEKEHVASLPGISSDEYKPSLEPGTINLRSVHPTYTSPYLKSQTLEQTAAAWEKMNTWQQKLTEAKGTDRLEMVGQMLGDFDLVYITHGDPLHNPLHQASTAPTEVLRLHGIGRGLHGYMVLDLAGDEELEETCVELSENTWFPQLWAGGKFVGGWRDICDHHNAGSLVQILEGCGLASKLKGCYYDKNTPLVLH